MIKALDKRHFEEVLNIMKQDLPNSVNVFYSMKFYHEGRTGSIAHKFFAYPWPNPLCFMAIRINTCVDQPSVFFYSKKSENHKENLILFFRELQKTEPELFWSSPLHFESNQLSDTLAIQDYAKSFGKFEDKPKDSIPCRSYYIPMEKWDDLLKLQILEPKGYFYDQLTEADIETVSNTWQYRMGDDYAHMKFKIENLPNICLREKNNRRLAAFETLDASGFMNHLYTMPEHRNKGLGQAVELKLAQKLVAEDILPFKSVLGSNEAGLAVTKKNNSWWLPTEDTKWHLFEP